MTKEKYGAHSIKVLKKLEPVRRRPEMYVGDRDSTGLWICGKEVIDNAFDEASNGFANEIHVGLKKNTLFVYDNGRGIPVEKHPTEKVSTLEVVFTTLHAGGKFDEKTTAYKKGSVGTFGLGASITCALSKSLRVYSFRKKWYSLEFRDGGSPTSKNPVVSKPPQFASNKKGTFIEYDPDLPFFQQGTAWNPENIRQYLELRSYLLPLGITIYWYNGSKVTKIKSQKTETLVTKRVKELETEKLVGIKPFVVNDGKVACILQWTEIDSSHMDSYVCGSPTKQGGTHMKGLYEALWEVLKIKAKTKIEPVDLEAGLVGVLNLNIVAPTFSGQTKNRLSSDTATNIVYQAVLKELKKYFAHNKELGTLIVEKAVAMREAADNSKEARKLASSLKIAKAGKILLPAKLLHSPNIPSNKRTLFLVEGDSAKGSCINARQVHQDVLPLRGKVLNVVSKGTKTNSGAIIDILKSIGYNSALKDPFKKLRVSAIYILSDADADGNHIAILLLGMLYTYLPELFKRGMVYYVDTPLFSYRKGVSKVYGDTLEHIKSQVGKSFDSRNVTRMKGWAEASSEDMRQFAFDPKTSKYLRIEALEKGDVREFLGVLGDDSASRKKLLGIA